MKKTVILYAYYENNNKPKCIFNLAAETHVDRSINDPSHFIKSNILGTFNLIESAKINWESLDSNKKKLFRFHFTSNLMILLEN